MEDDILKNRSIGFNQEWMSCRRKASKTNAFTLSVITREESGIGITQQYFKGAVALILERKGRRDLREPEGEAL